MANILYQAGLADLLANSTNWLAGTWKVLLERNTSTYSPSKADDSILNASGLVQISVATYEIKTVTGMTITKDDVNSRVVFDCDDTAFGNLESGQTVKSVILYRDDGGNGVPLLRLDTDAGGLLPRDLGGGSFTVTWNSTGLLTIAQV
jgi:hypothetical protein